MAPLFKKKTLKIGHFEWMHLNGGQVVPCRKQMAGCWWPLGPNRAGNHARRHCRVQAPLTKNLGKVNGCNGKAIGTYNISKNFKDVWNCLGTILIFQKSFGRLWGRNAKDFLSLSLLPWSKCCPVRGELMGI